MGWLFRYHILTGGIMKPITLALLHSGLFFIFSNFYSTVSTAENPYYRKIPFTFERIQRDEKEYDAFGQLIRVNKRSFDTWTQQEKMKLIQGLAILANQMLRPEILKCSIDNAKVYYVTGCNSKIENRADYEAMLSTQLRGLLNQGFPPLYIKRASMQGSAGEAFVGQFVDVRNASGGNYTVKGQFTVSIDASTVNSAHTQKGYEMLAGVLAHEMLHQMCHNHQKSYSDDNFMTVFGDCVQNLGKYVSRSTTGLAPGFFPDFGCFKPGAIGGGGTSPIALDPSTTVAVLESNRENVFEFRQKVRVMGADGKWSVDGVNYGKVDPFVGHPHSEALEKHAHYKVDKTLPFGVLIVKTSNGPLRVTTGMILNPGRYVFQINDTFFSDNVGKVNLYFKNTP
jgi:hypothetical protein